MTPLWEKIKSWFKDTTQQLLRETEELSKKGRLKMQASFLKSEITKKLSHLGSLVYQMVNEGNKNIEEEERIKEVISEIKKLEEALKRLEEEYKKI